MTADGFCVTIDLGGERRSFRRLDDAALFLRELHDAYQASRRDCVERRLRLGQALVQMRRAATHGQWLAIVARMGIKERTARRAMSEARAVMAPDGQIDVAAGLRRHEDGLVRRRGQASARQIRHGGGFEPNADQIGHGGAFDWTRTDHETGHGGRFGGGPVVGPPGSGALIEDDETPAGTPAPLPARTAVEDAMSGNRELGAAGTQLSLGMLYEAADAAQEALRRARAGGLGDEQRRRLDEASRRYAREVGRILAEPISPDAERAAALAAR